MADEKKPKRKYTRRAKVQPMNVYSVVVTVKRGRKTETIYGESTRVENGCLVVVSMDGPPPLVEKVRYIPLGSAEIEVCRRPQPPALMSPWAPYVTQPTVKWTSAEVGASHQQNDPYQTTGPQIQPGPLEIARAREAQGFRPVQRPQGVVERNADGIPVVTAGFMDGSPT